MTSDMTSPDLVKVVRKSTIPMDYEVFATDSSCPIRSSADFDSLSAESQSTIRAAAIMALVQKMFVAFLSKKWVESFEAESRTNRIESWIYQVQYSNGSFVEQSLGGYTFMKNTHVIPL